MFLFRRQKLDRSSSEKIEMINHTIRHLKDDRKNVSEVCKRLKSLGLNYSEELKVLEGFDLSIEILSKEIKNIKGG